MNGKPTAWIVDWPPEALQLDLTERDLMRDLDPGWLEQSEPEVASETVARLLEERA